MLIYENENDEKIDKLPVARSRNDDMDGLCQRRQRGGASFNDWKNSLYDERNGQGRRKIPHGRHTHRHTARLLLDGRRQPLAQRPATLAPSGGQRKFGHCRTPFAHGDQGGYGQVLV